MVLQKRNLVTPAAVFGAAMTSLYVTPELQADIVAVNFNPSSIGTGASLTNVSMSAAGLTAAMQADNSAAWGKNFYLNTGLVGLQFVSASQTITYSQITGGGAVNSYSASGTAFIGFSFNGNVGWFQVDYGTGAGDTVTIVDAAYGNAGEALHVGTAVPEPSAAVGLGLLALGAVGVRRRKKVA